MQQSKKKVYYAHSKGIYNTKQEERDIELLEELGFEVINPNTKEISDQFRYCVDINRYTYEYSFDLVFGTLVKESDIVAFRAQLDGLIGAGVAKEIEIAEANNKPIIELPSAIYKRIATLEQTRAYLKEIGER